MALEQKLSLKLAQRLVMTPSLQQAIKLLQMTRMELEGVLTQELVENPVLEENTEVSEEAEPEAREPEQPAAEKKDDPLEQIDVEAYFSDYMEGGPGYASIREDREDIPFENTLTREPDIYDHLLWQLHMSEVDAELRNIAELIIGNLDPDGFLVASEEELCELAREACTDEDEARLEKVRAALTVVRRLDPPGIAQPDLRSSLLAQLEMRGVGAEELASRVIAECWELFLRRQFVQIAKLFGVDLRDLEPVVEQIKSLETRPGRQYTSDRPHYIEPDVAVRKVGDDYVIQLNDDGLPRLRVSRAYRRMLQQMRSDGRETEAQQFIRDKMRSAVWLIKSLDQRQRTIYKVANSIVQQQRDFLDHGIEHLRPMVLRDVAEDIGMHESTVSRVVSNKYMHTPRGLFPLKFFFHSGIDRDYGENISSLTVKRKLQQIIENENPRHPLSDSELMRILKREGIQIARRTVAKYREELNIPSSTDRKKIF